MSKTQDFKSTAFMITAILAGALVSVVLSCKLVYGDAVFDYRSFLLGAAFSGLGWFLAENIGEAAFLLLLTGTIGAVALSYLHSEMWRVVLLTFVCGFNIGKICGGIYHEFSR
ncbi:MAG: hypothetical protein PVJ01_05375 [Pseudomonadota bacterium]|jgi:hypothetical protein